MVRSYAVAAVFVGMACEAAPPRAAVCRIEVAEKGGQAYGSGTLIDARQEYGLVVTNWHVVRDATGPVTVIFPNGYRSEARTVKLDETWDLAALVIWRPPTEPAPLAATPPQPGEVLTICGYGQGDYREATGRCTDYYAPEVGKPMELVELSVEARQGDSGGPILNQGGEVAGVLFGAARGVTLGSYGGRVRGFLASLAPDIGLEAPAPTTAVALGTPSTFSPTNNPSQSATPSVATFASAGLAAGGGRQAPAVATKPSGSAIDPFQQAEQSGPRAPATTLGDGIRPNSAWPNPIAQPGQYATSRPDRHDWRSVPYDAWEVAAKQSPPGAAMPFPPASTPIANQRSSSDYRAMAVLSATPQLERNANRSAIAPAGDSRDLAGSSLAQTSLEGALDWDTERTTLGVIVGAAAVVVLIGRAFA
ncbi:S1 family peptidase [Botrimarina hoheduenensis]|nr:serine protease [Botrimarina hoheduenensis]